LPAKAKGLLEAKTRFFVLSFKEGDPTIDAAGFNGYGGDEF
jgi:hypothetical protein